MAYIILGNYTTTSMPDMDGYRRALKPVGGSRRTVNATKVIHRSHRGKWTYSLKWSGLTAVEVMYFQAALVYANDVPFTDIAGNHLHCELMSASFDPLGTTDRYVVSLELDEV